MKYICNTCNIYIYDEKKGDPKLNFKPGTLFEEISDNFRCPICNAKKKMFKKLNNDNKEISNGKKHIQSINKEKNEKLNYIQIRNNSREKLQGICAVNVVCDGDPDRFCMGQSYGSHIGLGGVGKGLSFTENIKALDKIKLKTRIISKHFEPDFSTKFLDYKISIPVMTSSLSGVRISMGGSMSEMDFAVSVLQGAKDADTIGWIGNTCDVGQELTGIKAVEKVGFGIPIFKPQRNNRLIELIQIAEKAKVLAVGVDLDGVGSTNWELNNKPIYRKSFEDLKDLVDSTKLPFIAKGIMSVDDAILAVDAGVKVIDVSNHGGRALDSTRGVADVLPEIVDVVDKKVTITAGGGIRTGFDVMKMLALGADAVLIGRDIIKSAIGGGSLGVKLFFDYIKSDLRRGMIQTSCNNIKEIDKKILDSPDK
jgi:isopentenyl diphosphate isomerase/L-lactate dehydrogenase-like FMN-dependent dehydrogenase/rubredoxin